MNVKQKKIKPILRWAGGKHWLIERISHYLPSEFLNYHEPFVGGASIFINLNLKKKAYISDSNSELICFYKQVKENPEKLIFKIKELTNSEEEFYKIRNHTPKTDIDIATRFYYLNKTCFNGIYRVNQKGIFNVPYGRRNIDILDIEGIQMLSIKLQKTSIRCVDFQKALSFAKAGDFVFLDPPYTVAHNKNGFIEYNQKIFSWEDQERLALCVRELIKRKIFFIMTNANHESLLKLYKNVGKQFEVERFSTMSGHINSRIKVSELIITNCI